MTNLVTSPPHVTKLAWKWVCAMLAIDIDLDNVMKRFLPIALATLALVLPSCGLSGSISSLKNKMPTISAPKLPEIKRGDVARFSFSDLLPSKVPVVEVKADQLKEMQLGKDKALAYQKKHGFFGSWFGQPIDFKEPDLPSGALDNPEFGLLPPKSE